MRAEDVRRIRSRRAIAPVIPVSLPRVQCSDHLFIRENAGKISDVPHNRVGENSIGELAWVPQ